MAAATTTKKASLLGLLLAVLLIQSGFLAVAPAAAVQDAAPSSLSSVPIPAIPFSLGFGPSSLSPVSNGIPVYTVGDTIWVSSGFNSSVSISLTAAATSASAAPASVLPWEPLVPQTILPLHTFASSDADGVWNVTVLSQQAMRYVIPVHFVNLADHPVGLGPLHYSLDGGNVSISTQANLGDSYDQEVCAAGNATVSLDLPTGMNDVGNVTLRPGSPFTVVASGNVNESTSFWFELYHSYGMDVASANSVLTNNQLTAESQHVILATNKTSTTTLTWSMPLHEGRYELMAYFQNSTSVEVVQSKVLIINDSSWVSLSSPCQPMAVSSQDISYSTSLTSGLQDWPRNLYLMYRVFGVDSVVAYRVNANITGVNFVAAPWNEPLQNVKVNVTPLHGVLQTSQEGSSLFVLASQYPAQFNYSVDIAGGRALAEGSSSLNASYETETDEVPMAMLVVHVNGNQSSPSATTTSINVTGSPGVDINSGPIKGSHPAFSVVLPAGSYTVTASSGGTSQSALVSLSDGVATTVNLNLSTFPTLEVILVVMAIMGVVGNVLVWMTRPRSLGSRRATPK